MSQKEKYIQYAFIPIRFADPISAMKISNNHLVFGTMMGKIVSYQLDEKKNNVLAESSRENISDISFDKEGNCDICVGDEKVVRYMFRNGPEGEERIRYEKYDLYTNLHEHNEKCENCFTMLSCGSLLKMQLCQPDEGNVIIKEIESVLEYKENLEINSKELKSIKMTNYSVPLDFCDNKFIWVEYLSEKDRNFCVINFKGSVPPYKKLLQKEFGHISHCKLLRNGKIFMVRSLNKCEIRQLDEDLKVTNSFEHIGDEVYAVDIIYDDELNEGINKQNISEPECIKVIVSNSKKKDKEIFQTKENDELNNKNKENQINLTLEKKDDVNFSIILLDIDGGVNIWRNNEIVQLFNLYDISNIEQDHKDKQFFSLGYAYYIRYDGLYFAISSDHGCYIITKN